MPAEGDDSIPLCDRHYLKALRACATVVDRPGGQGAKEAAIFSLALLQDIREAGWMTGERGKDAYAFAMKTCVRAQDAWSALALLDSAHDDGILQGMTLRTAAMQVNGTCAHWCSLAIPFLCMLLCGVAACGEIVVRRASSHAALCILLSKKSGDDCATVSGSFTVVTTHIRH